MKEKGMQKNAVYFQFMFEFILFFYGINLYCIFDDVFHMFRVPYYFKFIPMEICWRFVVNYIVNTIPNAIY